MVNIILFLIRRKPVISFCTREVFWDMDPAALMSHLHTTDRDSRSNQNLHTTFYQPTTDVDSIFSSLRPMDSKWKDLRVSFQRNYLSDGRVNETVVMVEQLSDLWKPGAMDRARPFVMNCSCI